MTLILTIANPSGAFQSSDYQLTDLRTGAPISDAAGSKQLRTASDKMDISLAFTGIATINQGVGIPKRTVDWLIEELKALAPESTLQQVCDGLSRRCSDIVAPFGRQGILELVLTVSAVGEPFRVAVISNIDWRKRPPVAKSAGFSIRIHTITKPFSLISGYRDSVPAFAQHRLRALARDRTKSPSEILGLLSQINAICAKNSGGYVNEECWVTSHVADGHVHRSASVNVGPGQGAICELFYGFDISDYIKKNFRAEPGKELSVVQSAGVRGKPTPLPPPFGEPRSFRFAASCAESVLRSPVGQEHISIRVSHPDFVVEMRCNEEMVGQVVAISLKAMNNIGEDFPKPLFPWPRLSLPLTIDDTVVPGGWELSLGYWVEKGVRRVVIPQSSRGIRNLAFLDPTEEMVLVLPTDTIEWQWQDEENAPSAIAQVRIGWRVRPDGSTG